MNDLLEIVHDTNETLIELTNLIKRSKFIMIQMKTSITDHFKIFNYMKG